MASDLDKLLSLCKCEVSVEVNTHRNYYESVGQYVRGARDLGEIPDSIFYEMVKRDTVVKVQFYTHTPVGFFSVLHYDVNEALDMAVKIAEREVG